MTSIGTVFWGNFHIIPEMKLELDLGLELSVEFGFSLIYETSPDIYFILFRVTLVNHIVKYFACKLFLCVQHFCYIISYLD